LRQEREAWKMDRKPATFMHDDSREQKAVLSADRRRGFVQLASLTGEPGMTSSIRCYFGTLALALMAALSSPLPASAQTQVGTLSCDTSGGIGLIITSQQRLNCTYQGLDNRIEGYFGTISKFGIDLGATTQGVLVWQVFAPSTDFGPWALEGDYIGASGQATAGVGATANVLVGGFNRAFSLQPLSIGAQTGINLAIGVANMTLVGRRGK
jgi:hypothetical protein